MDRPSVLVHVGAGEAREAALVAVEVLDLQVDRPDVVLQIAPLVGRVVTLEMSVILVKNLESI